MSAPLLAVGDGALGLWTALDAVFPTPGHQRCWNHRALNVQSKLPKALHSEVRKRLREMSVATSRGVRVCGTSTSPICGQVVAQMPPTRCFGTGSRS